MDSKSKYKIQRINNLAADSTNSHHPNDMSIQFFSQGNQFLKNKNLEEAVVAYREAIALNPDCYLFYHNLGEALAELGNLEEAVQAYRYALSLKPTSDWSHFQLGKALQSLAKPCENSHDKEVTSNADLFITEKSVLEQNSDFNQNGNLVEDIQIFKSNASQVLDLEKSDSSVAEPLLSKQDITNWSKEDLEAKIHKGDYDSVIALCNAILVEEPNNFYVYHKLGIAWESQGVLNQAIEAYQKSIEINPDYDKCYHNLGNALAAQVDLNGAAAAYKKATELNPGKLMSVYRLANVLSQQKKWDEAHQAYEKALGLDPNFKKAFNGLVDVLITQKNWDKLIDLYKKYLSNAPDSAELNYGLGKVLHTINDYASAEDFYQKALKLDPDLSSVYQDLRDVLCKQGKEKEATNFDRAAVYANVFQPKNLNHPEDERISVQMSQRDFESSFQEFSDSELFDMGQFCPITWDEKTGQRLSMAQTHDKLRSKSCIAQTKVDIVVCIYNALDDVKICLNSIIEHTQEFRLILIDDCSNSETQEFLQNFTRQFPKHLLVRNSTNLGYTKSANNGLLLSTSQYAVLLNSDVIATPNWLEKMIQCFETDPQIGVVGPLSNCASWQSVPELFGDKGDWKVNVLPDGYDLPKFSRLVESLSKRGFPQVDLINGFCYMIKRDILDTVGFLDEANFPYGYGEENDFSLRVGEAGFKLAIADHVYLYHSKSKSFGHKRRKELGRQGKEALQRKYPGLSFNTLTDKIRYSQSLIHLRDKLNQTLDNSSTAKVQKSK